MTHDEQIFPVGHCQPDRRTIPAGREDGMNELLDISRYEPGKAIPLIGGEGPSDGSTIEGPSPKP